MSDVANKILKGLEGKTIKKAFVRNTVKVNVQGETRKEPFDIVLVLDSGETVIFSLDLDGSCGYYTDYLSVEFKN